MNIIRVLVVDDSALIRMMISKVLATDDSLDVVGSASNGKEALELFDILRPDVIVTDLNMPLMGGIELIKEVMRRRRTPILVFSSFSKEGSKETMDALDAGAVDFLTKYDKFDDPQSQLAKDLIQKIKTISSVHLVQAQTAVHEVVKTHFNRREDRVVVIATSTGGPQTLRSIIPYLPKNLPCPVLVVQHMPPLFTQSLATRLDEISEIKVKEAQDGEEVKAGVVYIAPGDYHMELVDRRGALCIALNQEPKQLGVRPCADILFKSVATIFEKDTIALVLSGMGSDGTLGAKAIKEKGGTVFAQSESNCILYGMPKSVIEKGYYDAIVDLDTMVAELALLLET